MKEFNKEEFKTKTIDKIFKEPSKLLNGAFVILFDTTENKDHCCLLVMQKMPKNEIMLINEFYDEEAAELFEKLMSKEFNKEEFKTKTIDKTFKEPSKLLNGAIVIGFDTTENKDHCCLLVMQKMPKNEIMLINEFYDEEAAELFEKLMSKGFKKI